MKKLILFTAIIFLVGMIPSYAQHSDTLHPVADVFVYTWGGGQGGNAYLKFDISSLPANMVVSNTKLEVNVFARILPWDDDVKFINLNNQTWVEGDNGDMLWNSAKSDTIIQLLNFGTGIGWASSTDISQILLRDYNQSHSFCTVLLKDPDDGTMGPQSGVPATDLNDSIVVGNIIMGFNGYIMFRPREYSDQSKIPMFIIDYGIAPEVTVPPLSTAACYGDSVAFDVTATGDTTLLYQWQKNGVNINGATTSTLIINPATTADAGNYRCIVTNAFGADTSDVAVLSVNPAIIVEAGNPQTICFGDCVTIGGSPTVSGGMPPYLYSWSPAGSLNSNTVANPTACPSSTTTYCVTVIDAVGCAVTDCVTITVNMNPNLSITANPDSMCQGDCSIITASASGGCAPYIYSWNTGEIAQVITVCPFTTSTYCLTVMDCNGCTVSDCVIVTVNPLPTAYNVTGGGSYCSGGTGLPICLSGSDIGVSYYLYCSGVYSGLTILGTGAPICFGNQTTACCYTVVALNAATGCTNNMTGSACIVINPLPAPYNVTGGGSYCEGGSGVAIGLSGSDPGVTYDLQCNGVSTGAALAGTGAALNFGFQTTACCYTIVASTVATFCSDTMNGNACVTIDSVQVNVSATPDTICPGDCSDLMVTTNGGCPPYTYLWCTGHVSQTINICPVSSTTYTVTVVDCSGCTGLGSITVVVDPCPGISEYNNELNIQFIPNPFSNSAEITSDKYFNDAELNVYDILGNQVRCMKNISGNAINIYRQGLPDGMYFYKLSEKNITKASGKFILN